LDCGQYQCQWLLLLIFYLACNHFYPDGLVSYDDRQTCRCDDNWSRVLAICKQDKSSAGKVARSFSWLCEVENIILVSRCMHRNAERLCISTVDNCSSSCRIM
jgi:hypothetical protein